MFEPIESRFDELSLDDDDEDDEEEEEEEAELSTPAGQSYGLNGRTKIVGVSSIHRWSSYR